MVQRTGYLNEPAVISGEKLSECQRYYIVQSAEDLFICLQYLTLPA